VKCSENEIVRSVESKPTDSGRPEIAIVRDFLLFNRDPERILLSSGRTNLNHFPAKFAAASGEP
jgi:hypothetical protein